MRQFLGSVSAAHESISSSQDYDCLHGWVLKNGQEFASAELTAEERKIVSKAAGRKNFPLGYCFQNAQKLVLSDKTETLVYCEGFALKAGLIPLHHGWVSINGKVVDVTWRDDAYKNIMGKIHYGWCYFGAEFTREQVESQHLSRSTSIIDDWSRHWPLLRR